MTTRGPDGSRDDDARAPHRVPGPRRGRAGRAPRAEPSAAAPLRLTARGAILIMVAVIFGTAMLDHAIGLPIANGIAFIAVCVLTALFVRSTDVLTLTVSPPLAYFAAALLSEGVLTLGSDGFARGVAIGLATRLADIAPWLFAGTAVVLVVALFRGLPRNVRALSDEYSGRAERRPEK